ncbi:hypothetical protein ALC57_11016 [Trachymyrmex cornetzi]|uniref:Uncharacterized protein n=1 Tax=Trachymyrmex cornetzi TaxID=471704 RepID=A0A151J3E9_9HYME|nr:hypothetical protein ALC57_11016 [Trachymyrmex cornetzi]
MIDSLHRDWLKYRATVIINPQSDTGMMFLAFSINQMSLAEYLNCESKIKLKY